MEDARRAINAMEDIIQEDVGRNVMSLFVAAKGGLWRAATALSRQVSPKVGMITGFFVPTGSPPSAETDGPVGAALLAKGLTQAGIACRLATDESCRSACRAALDSGGLPDLPIDPVTPEESVDAVVSGWRDEQVTLVLSIERCGRSIDGTPRNMRGLNIATHTAELDDLFLAGSWETVAIGDGGNEIGMGSLPRSLIAENVTGGETIACVTPTNHLIVAGVSNWGAYALLGALAVLRQDWWEAMLACLDPELDRIILEGTVLNGPAVDGVTGQQSLSVDNLPLDKHHQKIDEIRKIMQAWHAV